MKSELHSQDRYELIDKIPCTPPTQNDKILTIIFGVIIFIGIPILAYLIENYETLFN